MTLLQQMTRQCKRCGHSWLIRDPRNEPKVCPNCNSPYWDRERTRPATVQAITKRRKR